MMRSFKVHQLTKFPFLLIEAQKFTKYSGSVVELGLDGFQDPGRPGVAYQLVLLAQDGSLQQIVHLFVPRHLSTR